MLNYIALDFETANGYRGSPCSVGLVTVRDGMVASREHWLMRPPAGYDDFSPFNIGIHGITPDMVEGAPRWHDVLPRLVESIGDNVVVAHNAVFDLGVIRAACAADGAPCPSLRFLCTVVLSRRALDLPNYKLPTVTAACGSAMTHHHDALADADGVVAIVSHLAKTAGVTSLEQLAERYGVSLGTIDDRSYTGSRSIRHRPARSGTAHQEDDPTPFPSTGRNSVARKL